MGVIVDKDVGALDVISKAYIRIENIEVYFDRGRFSYEISTYISKRARELFVIQEYINEKMSSIRVEIDPPEGELDRLGITLEQWNDWTGPGPWTDYEEIKFIYDEILFFRGGPVQRVKIEEAIPEDFPIEITPSNIRNYLYQKFYNNGNLIQMIRMPGAKGDLAINEIEHDFDTPETMINKWIIEYPFL